MDHRFDAQLEHLVGPQRSDEVGVPDNEQASYDPGPANTVVAEQAKLARAGTSGPATSLPHGEQIQSAFGDHDLSNVKAHVGGAAADANASMGSHAYTRGDSISFAAAPDLHTASHEAAHVVQQRQGLTGDNVSHERAADSVADAVVAGQSASALLGSPAGPDGAGDGSSVQYKLWSAGRFKRESSARLAIRALDKKLKQIDRLLARAHKASDDDRPDALEALLTAINAWLAEKEQTEVDPKTHAGREGHSSGNIRVKAVLELRDMVQAEMGTAPTGGPKTVVDTQVPTDLKSAAPTKGVVTLAVHRSEPGLYMKMVKFIQGKGAQPEVGHSWVHIKTSVGEREQGKYTFGFWPAAGWPKGLDESVPGKVLNPDHEHEAKVNEELTSGERLYKDYPVDGDQVQDALGRAQRLARVAPAYNATRYNCTTFAKDIVTTAGGSWPGAGLFMAPGALFASLAKQEKSNAKVHGPEQVTVDLDYMVYPRDGVPVEVYDSPDGSTVHTIEGELGQLKVLDPAFPNVAPEGYVTVRLAGEKRNLYVRASVLLDDGVAAPASAGADWVQATILGRAKCVDELTLRKGFAARMRKMGAGAAKDLPLEEETTLHIYSGKEDDEDEWLGGGPSAVMVRIPGSDETWFMETSHLAYARRFGRPGQEQATGITYKVQDQYGVVLAPTRSRAALNDPDTRREIDELILELNDPEYDGSSPTEEVVRVRVRGESEFLYTWGDYLNDGERGVFNKKGEKAPELPARAKRPARNSEGKKPPPLPKRTSRPRRIGSGQRIPAKRTKTPPPQPKKKTPPPLPLRPQELAKQRIGLGAQGVEHVRSTVSWSRDAWEQSRPKPKGLFGGLFSAFSSKSSSEVDSQPLPRNVSGQENVPEQITHEYESVLNNDEDAPATAKGTLVQLENTLTEQAEQISLTATARQAAKPEMEKAKARVDETAEQIRGKVEGRHVAQLKDVGVGILEGTEAMLDKAMTRGGLTYHALKVGGKLGKGGSDATVFNAKYLNMAELAYKCFQHSNVKDTQEESRREAKIMSELDHPNILRSGGDTDRPGKGTRDNPGYVMEKAALGSLKGVFAKMQSSTLTTFDRLLVSRYLIRGGFRALAEMHSDDHDYVHGDIKHDNFLLGDDLEPKLMDFGMSHKSHAPEGEFQGHARSGTAEFMAPEVAAGAVPEKESDIWSLGETLLYALFDWDSVDFLDNQKGKTTTNKERRRIGMSDDWQENLKRRVARDFPGSDDMATQRSNLLSFVASAMKQNPEERITAKDALDQPFLALTSEEETGAQRLLQKVV